MFSLRSRLIVLWVLSLAACVGAGGLLLHVSAQSTAAQIGRAEAVIAQSCNLIRERFTFYAAGWPGPDSARPDSTHDDSALRTELAAVVSLALARQAGVEGGIWQTATGSLAYAFPTYPNGKKDDLPAAEADRIRTINEDASHDERPLARRWSSTSETLLLEACTLPIPGLTAWAMTRVHFAGERDWLGYGIGFLLLLTLAITAWLAWVSMSWSRRVRGLETALAAAPDGERGPIAATGERDLDRLVRALNRSTARLTEARQRSGTLMAREAENRRLAALGRVAAGVAHEVRNPLTAIRLRAENALATGDLERGRRALEAVLIQVDRLDHLCGELLTLTQRRMPDPERLDLAALLRDCIHDWSDRAEKAGVSLSAAGAGPATLDLGLVRRALDSLLDNALRHAGCGGRVTVSAVADAGRVRIAVEDSGPGVPPSLRDSLFEPFVTGRSEGTGLGLAIARELVEAHGGSLTLGDGPATCFIIDLPREEPA